MSLKSLATFKAELEAELKAILNWWMTYTIDIKNGGFYGQIDNNNNVTTGAAKGLVLNTRILYTFSSTHSLNKDKDYLETATRAFNYLIENFADPLKGGFFWSVDEKGNMLDGKKQIYGQAFAIYAFAEYYKITKHEKAIALAMQTFNLLEEHSFDPIYLGYTEALTKNWEPIADLRLSNKDQNDKKSMNTHLHLIEAYANLYSVWPNEELKLSIKKLLANFKAHIINTEYHHLNLFFTETWQVKSSLISYGHDIEASWLLQEAAEIINDQEEIKTFNNIATQMTNAVANGLAQNGGLYYEFNTQTNVLVNEFHWWPQAEAMVGFYNAWQINGDEKYLLSSLKSWEFIKKYLKDKINGEWFWGVNNQYAVMQNEDKAGFWKCPYHNGRACIEIIKRISYLNL